MNRIKAMLIALLIMASVCATAAADHSATFDWRDVDGTNYVTPAKAQNCCKSCAAFASVGAIESNVLIQHPNITSIDLSEEYYVSDCWAGMTCDDGFGFLYDTTDLLTFSIDNGTPLETCCPYLGATGPSDCNPCENRETYTWYISSFRRIGTSYTATIKDSLISDGPIVASIYYDDFCDPDVFGLSGGHAVLVIGWNDSHMGGCWLCKNSAGAGWGYDGCGWIPYNALEHVKAYSVSGSYQNPPCERYDYNGDPGIQKPEAITAINDYLFEGIIQQWEAEAVIDCYYNP